MTHRIFYIMQQEVPKTDTPFWITTCTIDEERETVTHRVTHGPYSTKEAAKEILDQLNGDHI